MTTEANANAILKMLERDGALLSREMKSGRMTSGQVSVALGWLKRRKLVTFEYYWRLTDLGKIACRANRLIPS